MFNTGLSRQKYNAGHCWDLTLGGWGQSRRVMGSETLTVQPPLSHRETFFWLVFWSRMASTLRRQQSISWSGQLSVRELSAERWWGQLLPSLSQMSNCWRMLSWTWTREFKKKESKWRPCQRARCRRLDCNTIFFFISQAFVYWASNLNPWYTSVQGKEGN